MRREKIAVGWKTFRPLVNLLKAGPCLDCGVSYPPCVMDFDHREPGTKRFNVSQMAGQDEATIRAEVAKCDLVCSNCHRLRTSARPKAWARPFALLSDGKNAVHKMRKKLGLNGYPVSNEQVVKAQVAREQGRDKPRSPKAQRAWAQKMRDLRAKAGIPDETGREAQRERDLLSQGATP